MPFQFYCPQGHLLQGDESQMGRQSQCPLCGSLFVVPTPNPGMAQSGMGGPPAPPPQQEFVTPEVDVQAEPAPEPEPEPVPVEPEIPELLHIPCPNGHVLETPSDILGKRALCPHCHQQMDLLYENSVEYKRKIEQERLQKEEAVNQAFVTWSIRAAIGVGVSFAWMLLWLLVVKPVFHEELEGVPVVWWLAGGAGLAAIVLLIMKWKRGKKSRRAK